MPSDWVGRELGEYFVFERVGAGSMAEVFKALQPSMDRLVGIKVLSPTLSHDSQFVARFRREAQIAASLEHPHILPVIDFGECENTLYLVMRYVNGGTLHDLIERGPLPPATALRYLTEIGEALDYAHERRVVHRDIKPKNVLLDQQGNPFIGDFGLAKLVDVGGLTNSGMEMIGTPHYMSPEQARGQGVDGRADLYSLGVLLYQMLTGAVPFQADSTVGIVMKHIGADVPAITLARPALPEALNAVLAKAMAKEPDDRYQTAHALTQAVAEAPRRQRVQQPAPAGTGRSGAHAHHGPLVGEPHETRPALPAQGRHPGPVGAPALSRQKRAARAPVRSAHAPVPQPAPAVGAHGRAVPGRGPDQHWRRQCPWQHPSKSRPAKRQSARERQCAARGRRGHGHRAACLAYGACRYSRGHGRVPGRGCDVHLCPERCVTHQCAAHGSARGGSARPDDDRARTGGIVPAGCQRGRPRRA